MEGKINNEKSTMIQLPQRDIDLHLLSTGGPIPQSNGQATKTERKRKPWVYRSEYDKIKKERDVFRAAFMINAGIIAVLVLIQIFGRHIIDLIL